MKTTIFQSVFCILVFATTVLSSCQKEDIINADYEISVNEQFQLDFVSNPSTGYDWKWTNEPTVSIVETVSNNLILNPNPNPFFAGGVPGKVNWIFKGVKSGLDTIKFELCQPWNPNSSLEYKKFVVKVR